MGKSRFWLPLNLFRAYLCALFGIVLLVGWQNYRIQAPWNIGDWLINYSGGFVRRGLVGTIVLLASRVSQLSPSLLVLFIQIACFTALYWATWRLVQPIRWRLWSTALAFSPATLGFVALNGGGAFRKDLLFLVALAVLLVLLHGKMSDRATLQYLLATGVLISLSHEGMIVYWPYLLAAIAIAKQSLWSAARLSVMPTILLVSLTVYAGRHPGDLFQVKQICASVHGVFGDGLCSGAIRYLGRDSAYAHGEVVNSIRHNHYFLDYGVLALLALAPCVLAIHSMWHLPSSRASVQILLLGSSAAMLCSTPLFLYGLDWGRWIYIHVFALMLLLFFISGVSEPSLTPNWEWPLRFRGSAVVLMVLYLCNWHLPVTGEHRGWGYTGMAERHLRPRFSRSHGVNLKAAGPTSIEDSRQNILSPLSLLGCQV